MLQQYHLVPVWLFMIFKHFLKIVIFYFWLCWSLLLRVGFLQVLQAEATSLQCTGFSSRWLLLLQSTDAGSTGCSGGSSGLVRGSSSWPRECRLSSCGAHAQLLLGMWNFLGPGIKPRSPALAGRFFTNKLAGKSFFMMSKVILKQSHMLKVFPFYR